MPSRPSTAGLALLKSRAGSGGTEDLLFSACRTGTGRKVSRGKYLAIEGAAHSIHAEKPKEFAEAVLSFLKEGDNP
jgi:pimeloyl-ACP methyl ester carboxylesterase